MNLFRLMRTVALIVAAAVGLAACGQKGPLMLPPKDTTPRVVTPIILPGEGEAKDKAEEGAEPAEQAETPAQENTPENTPDIVVETKPARDDGAYQAVERESDEAPLGILPHTTRHTQAVPQTKAAPVAKKAPAKKAVAKKKR